MNTTGPFSRYGRYCKKVVNKKIGEKCDEYFYSKFKTGKVCHKCKKITEKKYAQKIRNMNESKKNYEKKTILS